MWLAAAPLFVDIIIGVVFLIWLLAIAGMGATSRTEPRLSGKFFFYILLFVFLDTIHPFSINWQSVLMFGFAYLVIGAINSLIQWKDLAKAFTVRKMEEIRKYRSEWENTGRKVSFDQWISEQSVTRSFRFHGVDIVYTMSTSVNRLLKVSDLKKHILDFILFWPFDIFEIFAQIMYLLGQKIVEIISPLFDRISIQANNEIVEEMQKSQQAYEEAVANKELNKEPKD
jgi:hypothetical protein